MWTIGRDQPVIPGVTFIRWASPLLQVRVGSLRSAFATAWDVPLAAGLPYAFTLSLRFPSGAREPYTRLRCHLGKCVNLIYISYNQLYMDQQLL